MKKIILLTEKSVKAIFTGMFIFILLDVIFLSFQDYCDKQKFIMSNIGLIIITFVILAALTIVLYKKYNLIEMMLSRNWQIKITVAVILLLIIQIFICSRITFFTGWDARNVFLNAQRIARGEFGNLDNLYFSRYPNNIFITGIFSGIIKICSFFCVNDNENQLIALAVVQCVLSSVAGLLIFLTIKDWLKSLTLSWVGWIAYVILLGTSPWLVIPYSDSMGILIPILILRIYHFIQNGKRVYIKWIAVSVLAFIGYHIKPQTLIVFIAVLIIESAHLISEADKKKLKKSAFVIAVIAVVVIVSSAANQFYRESLGFKLDKNKEMGMMHFAMMGLNNVTDGVYYAEDVKYSFDFPDVKSRNAGNMKVIKERIANYNGIDFMMHIIRKALINFNDGTFAYGKEGEFYVKEFPDKDKVISPMLRSIFWVSGKNYGAFAAVKQSVWLLNLMLMIGFVISYSKFRIEDKEQQSLYLSLIGITVFEMIFEPRARYLLVYGPFFIIAGVMGYQYITKIIKKKYNAL